MMNNLLNRTNGGNRACCGNSGCRCSAAENANGRNNSGTCRNCGDEPIIVLSPRASEVLTLFYEAYGTARPCAEIEVTVDGGRTLYSRADIRGFWSVAYPYPMATGIHKLTAMREGCRCSEVEVGFMTNLTAPVITSPVSGTVDDARPALAGYATPGTTITLALSPGCRFDTPSGPDGRFRIRPATALRPGRYKFTARQTDRYGVVSETAECVFTVGRSSER